MRCRPGLRPDPAKGAYDAPPDNCRGRLSPNSQNPLKYALVGYRKHFFKEGHILFLRSA